MPTFDSIHFSRELANRLVAVSDTSRSRGNNRNKTPATATGIATPLALISRHPNSLRLRNEDGSISKNPMHCNGFPELRREVAGKLVALSLAGQRSARLESILQLHQQQQDDNNDELDLCADPQEMPPPISFPGTSTALDMLRYQTLLTATTTADNSRSCDVVSTGSLSLDSLLGLPTEMAASISSSMPRNLCLSTPTQGLPWGHIIQCSGPPASGKTQLALSVAASAAGADANNNECGVLYLASAAGHGSLRSLVLRFKQFVVGSLTASNSATGNNSNSRQRMMATMDRVSFQVVEDGYQLLTVLAELEQQFLSSDDIDSKDPTSPLCRVVIIDAASGCLSSEDDTLLHRVALRLKHLARHYHLLVWINNASMLPSTFGNNNNQSGNFPNNSNNYRDSIGSVVDGFQPGNIKRKVALGATWNKRVADLHVSLDFPPQSSHATASSTAPTQEAAASPSLVPHKKETVIRATLEAHPFRKCHPQSLQTADISITTRGIQDYHPVSDLPESDLRE